MNLCSSYAKFSELALNQPTPPKPKPNGYVLKLYQIRRVKCRQSITRRVCKPANTARNQIDATERTSASASLRDTAAPWRIRPSEGKPYLPAAGRFAQQSR